MSRPILHFLEIAASAAVAVILVFAIPPAMAQAPSKAQQSAIRSACPSDYKTYCASVPPGGMPALNCLQQNAAKLSDACRTAVQAVGGSTAATPPAASGKSGAATTGTGKTTGAATTNKAPAAAAPPAGDMAPREAGLIRQACRRDFRTHCRGVPIGGGNVIACLRENAASLSPGCKSALAPLMQ
ncbi:cysteine rich repeat-containing protein [Kaistia nematophila]|uniref:Cysteine rich repeat-containing protein n=1 Tax=Kaistia nematophila TaxID=2994654 RepID=A0A9X3E6M4_9HYPH|nr:cysteine rich repeat-containing protein [Kaistia nematophila]MCX5571672.1 cysteine rich repeat-containing protein [Kaistia nematophila]